MHVRETQSVSAWHEWPALLPDGTSSVQSGGTSVGIRVGTGARVGTGVCGEDGVVGVLLGAIDVGKKVRGAVLEGAEVASVGTTVGCRVGAVVGAVVGLIRLAR